MIPHLNDCRSKGHGRNWWTARGRGKTLNGLLEVHLGVLELSLRDLVLNILRDRNCNIQ